MNQKIIPRSRSRALVNGVGRPARKYQSQPRCVRRPGGQRRTGALTLGERRVRHRRDVQGQVAEQRHVMISQGATEGELVDQSVMPTAAERDQVTERTPHHPTAREIVPEGDGGIRVVFPAKGWLPVGTVTASSDESEKSCVSSSRTRGVNVRSPNVVWFLVVSADGPPAMGNPLRRRSHPEPRDVSLYLRGHRLPFAPMIVGGAACRKRRSFSQRSVNYNNHWGIPLP
jgi:hypothetical protein